MDAILDALAGISWRDWATVIGVGFGVISLVAWLEQRRAARKQVDLFEFVRRHVAKDISEETIRQLEAQREALQREVAENIPALARAAVLREQANVHAAAAAQHFREWKRIQGELATSPSGGSIDPAMESIIVDRLVPHFERQANTDRLRNRVTVFSVSLALISAVLPFPLNSMAGAIIAVPLVATLLQFLEISHEGAEIRRTLRPVAIAGYLIVSVTAGAFGVMLISIGRESVTEAGLALGWALIVIGVLSLALAPWAFRRMDRYFRRIPIGGTTLPVNSHGRTAARQS